MNQWKNLVNEAIEDALKKHSCYNRIVREIIAELNNICLEKLLHNMEAVYTSKEVALLPGTIIQSH